MVRVLACHAKGRGFKPRFSRFYFYFIFMIQVGTLLNVIDNSGATQVKCLKILKGYKRRYGYVGDLVLVSVKNLREKRKEFSRVKKGDICKALIVRTKVSP